MCLVKPNLEVYMDVSSMPPATLDYEDLFQAMPIACHEINLEGTVVRVNRAECALLGFEADELIGKHCSEFVTASERNTSRQAVEEKLRGMRSEERRVGK